MERTPNKMPKGYQTYPTYADFSMRMHVKSVLKMLYDYQNVDIPHEMRNKLSDATVYEYTDKI